MEGIRLQGLSESSLQCLLTTTTRLRSVLVVSPLGPVLGIPRCASKILKIFDFMHRGHCLYIVSDFLNRSPLDGLLRLNSVFVSTLGTPGPVLRLQRPLAGRLPPSYFSRS
jgi:hypothetical protein